MIYLMVIAMVINFAWSCPHCDNVKKGSTMFMVTDFASGHLGTEHNIDLDELDHPLFIRKI